MKKLRDIIEKATEGNKRTFKSLYDIKEAMRIYNDIVKNNIAYTMNSSVMNVCLKCKLNIVEDGIGWSITK